MNKPRAVFLSAISGNILEYYDFTVYSVFSAAIARTFFPHDTEFNRTLLTLAVFAVGFLPRPIGGIFFGFIGDRYGRRIALIVSMLGMTIPTFMIGPIPAYCDIGIYAPAILILMRLIQGLCISGEGAGAAIFILEHHQNLRAGFTAGLVHGSNIAGTLIASLIGIIIELYFHHMEFAWRFAFLLGGFMGVAGFYLRLRVSETPIFEKLSLDKKNLKVSLFYVLKEAKRSMFLTFCVAGCASSTLYLVKTYVNVFYHDILHYDNTKALAYMSYASIIAMITMPLFGYISDIIGRFRAITYASLAILLLALPTTILMGYPDQLRQIIALTLLGGLGGAISGAAYIFIISLFTPEQKYSGVAFSYNFGIAVFGGTSPVISRWLVEKLGFYYAPSLYIMLTSFLFLCVLFFTKDYIRGMMNSEYDQQQS